MPEMIDKLYTYAGTSHFEGETTYRFGSGDSRRRKAVLERNGHTAVSFRDLPRAMKINDAVAWLQAQGIQAVLPGGQRRGPNGGTTVIVQAAPKAAEQMDAHVTAWEAAKAAEAEKKAAFVARMAAARAAKKLLAEAQPQAEQA